MPKIPTVSPRGDRTRGLLAPLLDGLREEILSGQRAPGERLTELAVAEQYGTSRVPAREAIRILEGEGLIVAASPRVRVVAAVSDTDAADMFELRGTLEAIAAARAAERGTAAQHATLRTILEEGQSRLFSGEIDALPDLNTRFHAAIADASGSAIIGGMVNQILPRIAQSYTAAITGRAMGSWREHAAIVQAITDGDAVLARRLTREHIAGAEYAYGHREDAHEVAGGAANGIAHHPSLRRIVGQTTNNQSVWRVKSPQGPLVAGVACGPLAGIRTAVKDLFAVRDHAIGAGNPAWLSRAPRQAASAAVVAALTSAGADVVGIAQCDELGFSIGGVNAHYGSPPNPVAPGHLTGGSSSGPAAAVAGGDADLGIGTDTAGSVRVPASYCGLYGLRLTHGSVDLTGMIPLAPSFDALGLLTRDHQTLAATLSVIAPSAKTSPTVRLLLAPALLRSIPDYSLRPFREWVDRVAAVTGAELNLIPVEESQLRSWYAEFRTVQHAEVWAQHGGFIADNPGALAPDIEERFLAGSAVGQERETAARAAVGEAAATVRGWLPPGTVLLLPSTPGPSPRLDTANDEFGYTRRVTLMLTFLASLAGLPALAAPFGKVGRLPLGFSLMTTPGYDRSLIDLVASIPEAP
jgi:amidase